MMGPAKYLVSLHCLDIVGCSLCQECSAACFLGVLGRGADSQGCAHLCIRAPVCVAGPTSMRRVLRPPLPAASTDRCRSAAIRPHHCHYPSVNK